MDGRWIDFVEELCIRFGERNITDVIEEFNKLKQEGSVAKYQERFVELGALMLSCPGKRGKKMQDLKKK